jgi:hypothetical protein
MSIAEELIPRAFSEAAKAPLAGPFAARRFGMTRFDKISALARSAPVC